MILPIVKKVSYKEGDVIIDEGEIGSEIFILTKGLVSVTQKLVLGKESFSLDKEKIVSKLSSENTPFFGEIAIFGDKKRTASVQALTYCELLKLDEDGFYKIANDNIEVGFKILKSIVETVCERLSKANNDILKLSIALAMALKR